MRYFYMVVDAIDGIVMAGPAALISYVFFCVKLYVGRKRNMFLYPEIFIYCYHQEKRCAENNGISNPFVHKVILTRI
jgi:hypothetical protein